MSNSLYVLTQPSLISPRISSFMTDIIEEEYAKQNFLENATLITTNIIVATSCSMLVQCIFIPCFPDTLTHFSYCLFSRLSFEYAIYNRKFDLDFLLKICMEIFGKTLYSKFPWLLAKLLGFVFEVLIETGWWSIILFAYAVFKPLGVTITTIR